MCDHFLSGSQSSIDGVVGFVPMETKKPVAISLGDGIGFGLIPELLDVEAQLAVSSYWRRD